MRIVLAGQPGAGKSTLFEVLSGREGGAAARGTGLRIVHVPVPDERLDRLSAAWKPKKTTPARLEFQDFEQKSGPTYPALSPERREMLTRGDLIVLLVDLFSHSPEDWTDEAARQWREMAEEFALLDLATVEKRLERLNKALKIGQKPAFPTEPELLERFRTALESGRSLRTFELSPEERVGVRGYGFLTAVQVFPAFNVSEDQLAAAAEWLAKISADPTTPAWLGPARLVFSAEVERQIQELPPDEQPTFLEAFGLREPAVAQIIRIAYELAGLHCFFTTGDDEVRAWSVRRGARAPEAAGEIHSDLEKGFVRAEVLSFDDWARLGAMSAARDQGALRLEGKEYVVRDGDLMNIRSGLAKSRG